MVEDKKMTARVEGDLIQRNGEPQGTWERAFLTDRIQNSWEWRKANTINGSVIPSENMSQLTWEEIFTNKQQRREAGSNLGSKDKSIVTGEGKSISIPDRILPHIENLWASIVINVEIIPTTILICGSSKGEGASVTSLYLAMYSALKHFHKTLYVDLDLDGENKPYLYKGSDEMSGFARYCLDNLPLISVIFPTEHENLFIIPSWSRKRFPLSTVVSRVERVKAFFEEAKNHFEVIIIDGSPVLSNPGIASIGKYVDQVLLACRYGYTRYEVASLAARKLEEAGVKRLAAVLTCREYPVPPLIYRLLK
ncbi:MAG: CpsD/CapB family tyrosine-protein kinase [Syntrophobacterales bacterium]|nr:CpsD/CapB family tyrosine-protein kinase [Syntrophobacterales bacterium]